MERCYACKAIAELVALMEDGSEIYCCKKDIPKGYRELWKLS
jgi:hypothetical protein